MRTRDAALAAVGPLALAAFFAGWVEGWGLLAGHTFSGFDLVGLGGRLQRLDLSAAEAIALWMGRGAVLGVAIAATWQTILAFGLRGHRAYSLSGWYLAASAAVLAGMAMVRGPAVPPGGALLLGAAGAVFVGLHVLPAKGRSA